MRLSEVLSGCSFLHTRGDLGTEIYGITPDSRQVSPGYVFVANRGVETDGNRFVTDAIGRGAAAISSETPGDGFAGATWV